MSRAEDPLQPQIHNMPGQQATITGLEIADPTPFTDVLQAMGLPLDEVPVWSIYTDHPVYTEVHDPRAIVVDPGVISTAIASEIEADKLVTRNWRFMNGFSRIAPKVIPDTVTLSVADHRRRERHVFALTLRPLKGQHSWLGSARLSASAT